MSVTCVFEMNHVTVETFLLIFYRVTKETKVKVVSR